MPQGLWGKLCFSIRRQCLECPHVTCECLMLDISMCVLKNLPMLGKGGWSRAVQNLWLERLWGCTQQGRISLPGHMGDAVQWKLEAEIQLWEPMFCSTTPVGMGQNQAMLSLLPSGNTYQCSHVQDLPWVMPVFSCYSPWCKNSQLYRNAV